ncbi:MAG: o-succinylbenzoate synthase [Microthrixaceae bacterium]
MHRVAIPLRTPWRSGAGSFATRDTVLVRVDAEGLVGWGEAPALPEPTYTAEYAAGAAAVLADHLVPRWFRTQRERPAGDLLERIDRAFADIEGHRMARSGLITALLDAHLRGAERSLAAFLGASTERVDAGLALGLADNVDRLVGSIGDAQAAGYRRVKFKVAPGREPWVIAVRDAFPGLNIAVDANGAYDASRDGVDALRSLDPLGLDYIEQPLAADDLAGHARVAERLRTPLCLDEAVETTADLDTVAALSAARVLNVKAARCGGPVAALRLARRARAGGLGVFCGGMVETGVGRAASVALAATPPFTLTGDLTPTSRFFDIDVVDDGFVIRDGTIAVPSRPGLGVEVDDGAVRRFATSSVAVRSGD